MVTREYHIITQKSVKFKRIEIKLLKDTQKIDIFLLLTFLFLLFKMTKIGTFIYSNFVAKVSFYI